MSETVGTPSGGRAVVAPVSERLREIVVDDNELPYVARLPASYDPDRYRVVPHGIHERAHAGLLEHAARTVPQFLLRFDCRMEEVERARARMNGGIVARTGKPLALTDLDFVVKALALALQQVASANVTWAPDAMIHHEASDVTVVVAVPRGPALVVIADAELASLHAISDTISGAIECASSDQVAPLSLGGGGSISVHSLGAGAAAAFECMVVPPQSGALALGQVESRPVVRDGAIAVGRVMSCALACDQRAIAPADAAALVAVFKSLIEDPLKMLV